MKVKKEEFHSVFFPAIVTVPSVKNVAMDIVGFSPSIFWLIPFD